MAVSKRLRFEVMRRDDHACRYCGASAPDARLTVDHVVPIALGGGDEPENLVTACLDCNAGKSSVAPDSPLVENVADDALRWATAMEEAAKTQRTNYARNSIVLDTFAEEWNRWTDYLDNTFPIPADWTDTVSTFLESGLSNEDLAQMVEVSLSSGKVSPSSKWRYFCGCCWHRIRDRQEMARAIVETDATEGE